MKYDFSNDPAGEIIWKRASDEATSRFPLKFGLPENATTDEVKSAVCMIVEKFKDLIENNGLWAFLYKADSVPKHESASQLLFFGISDCYCEANNIDLSREPDGGRGPVDFKYSRGYFSRVLVEIKLSTNARLEHGFSTQIQQYQFAEKTESAMCVIIQVAGGNIEKNNKRVNNVIDLAAAAKKSG